MGTIYAQRLQQTDAVCGHVSQRVRRHGEGTVHIAGDHGGDEGGQVDRVVVDLGRETAVTFVVPDHVATLARE